MRRPIKVLITDNQCIEPAVGGGRLRLLGLYKTLTDGIEATYVGTYDWQGPEYRELQLSKRLREIDIPQSPEHFVINDHLNALLPGKTIIDVTIPWLVWSSPTLVETVCKHAAAADVVILAHPWMYGCVRDVIRESGKLIIYDSQNCEAVLRAQLLGSNEFGTCLVQNVKWLEGVLCEESDLILACSEEDKQTFIEVYGVNAEKIIVVPNGVNVRAIRPASPTARARARQKLALEGFVALFIGSAYPPNLEAVGMILNELAPANPEVTFLLVGGASERSIVAGVVPQIPSNVRLLGMVSDAERNEAYAAADVAINPMFTGSGTNIKMLDFLAAGLPTLTTPVGARGIHNRDQACFIVDDSSRFSDWLSELRHNTSLRASLTAESRKLAEETYNWRRLSAQLGRLIIERFRAKSCHGASPYFSIIIPSYERPASLKKLLELLSRQVFADFEVVVVDQSATPLELGSLRGNFALQYLHTTERGPAKSRNLGIKHAKGQVIAFTDDDCEPDIHWLSNAYKHFQDAGIVGLEGLVQSDTTDNERYRVVTNQGVEGLGFMTANLFIRRHIIDKLGGFDERFERPFREDTDFGWRALAYGQIPFAHDVKVVHPAPLRDVQRESTEGRTRFFEYDPLLFQKHPERYLQLLRFEKHYAKTPGFWEHFMRGMVRHRLDIPVEDLRQYTTSAQYALLGELSKLPGSSTGTISAPAQADIDTAVKEVIVECLSNMSQIEGAFPKADLLVNESSVQLAEILLENVNNEIASMGEDILGYFRHSRDRYQFTLQLIVDGPKAKVLDLGCSPGHVAMALSKAGFEVYGVDLSTQYLKKYVSQSWVKRLKIKQVAFEHEPIPFPDAFFEYVIFTEVLEHITITDPLKILLEIKRVLKPGGIMVLSTPNVGNISNVLALIKGDNIFWDPDIFYGFWDPDIFYGLDRHNREYTPREVVTLIAKAHFSRYELAYMNAPSNWNSNTPEIYELMGKWQDNPPLNKEPFLNNTIFIRAVK